MAPAGTKQEVLVCSCSSTELLVVHLCRFDESAVCSSRLKSVAGSRYPSNTQVWTLVPMADGSTRSIGWCDQLRLTHAIASRRCFSSRDRGFLG